VIQKATTSSWLGGGIRDRRAHVAPVAHFGAPNLDSPNPGLDCALRSMAVTHDAVAAIRATSLSGSSIASG
jgi:hypothetical protein